METRTEREPLLSDEELRASFDMVRRLRRDLPPDQLDRFVEGYGSGARWMEELMNERITSGALRVVEKGERLFTEEQVRALVQEIANVQHGIDAEINADRGVDFIGICRSHKVELIAPKVDP